MARRGYSRTTLIIKDELLEIMRKVAKLEAKSNYLIYEEAFYDLVKKYSAKYKKEEDLNIDQFFEKEFG